MKKNKYFNGFTLIEILVAILIFAFIIIGAQQIFSMASNNAESLKNSQKRLHQINITMQTIERDINQVISRTIRGPGNGFPIEPIQTDLNDNFLLKVTRGGWKNPLYAARPSIQAATYTLKDDILVRSYFPYLDNINDIDPVEQELIDKVTDIEIKFLNRQLEWVDNWPQFTLNNPVSQPVVPRDSDAEVPLSPPPTLPIAVELLIELEDYGTIRRLLNIAPAA